MKNIIKHVVNAATPRLSDEEPDPLENDDDHGIISEMVEGYLLWSNEDISDIRNLINLRVSDKERKVLNAFLEGLTYLDIGVTEKYYRYYFTKGIEFIKKELGI